MRSFRTSQDPTRGTFGDFSFRHGMPHEAGQHAFTVGVVRSRNGAEVCKKASFCRRRNMPLGR